MLFTPHNRSRIFRLRGPVPSPPVFANLVAEALDGIPAEAHREGIAMATTLYAFASILFAVLALGIPLVGVRMIEQKLR